MSFSLLGAKVSGDESSMERKFHLWPGAKVRGNESSSYLDRLCVR